MSWEEEKKRKNKPSLWRNSCPYPFSSRVIDLCNTFSPVFFLSVPARSTSAGLEGSRGRFLGSIQPSQYLNSRIAGSVSSPSTTQDEQKTIGSLCSLRRCPIVGKQDSSVICLLFIVGIQVTSTKEKGKKQLATKNKCQMPLVAHVCQSFNLVTSHKSPSPAKLVC